MQPPQPEPPPAEEAAVPLGTWPTPPSSPTPPASPLRAVEDEPPEQAAADEQASPGQLAAFQAAYLHILAEQTAMLDKKDAADQIKGPALSMELSGGCER